MKNFIKATEIWEPNYDKTELSLVSGLYGSKRKFQDYSEKIVFKYNEGLPGKAWAKQHPIVLSSLKDSYFKRTDEALKIDITAAIAMPVFSGEYLTAVVVFLCSDINDNHGAIELWGKNPERSFEMALIDGYYGKMESFAWISKSIKIMKGQGLPGNVWSTSMPFIIKDLGESATFLRASKAKKEGLSTAIAIPSWINEEDGYVMTFLSAKDTPIANRFEVWIPDETAEALVFRDGISSDGIDLKEHYKLTRLDKQNSIAGKAWKTGRPVLGDKFHGEKELMADAFLALPIIQNGFCASVVMFYF